MQTLWRGLKAIPRGILAALDWLVGVLERLTVIAIGCIVFYTGWQFLQGSVTQSLRDTVKALSDNWRILLLVLVPLFYRAVRSFLERLEEAWGMKAPIQKEKVADPTKHEGE